MTNVLTFRNQATSITLFTVALVFVFARTVIRFRYQKQLLLDDVFLFLGLLSLCAAFGLLMQSIEIMYPYMNEATTAPKIIDFSSLCALMTSSNKIRDAYLSLTYSTLFSVKLSFLFFFRNLVRRVRTMMVYWWTVLAIMCIAWPASIAAAVVPSCPVFCKYSSTTEPREFFLSSEANALISQRVALRFTCLVQCLAWSLWQRF